MGSAIAAAAAATLALLALAMRWVLTPVLGDQAPYLLLLLAPVLAAAWFGFLPGCLATVVALIGGQVIFIEPIGSPVPPNLAEWIPAFVYAAEGVLFAWLIDSRRQAVLESSEREQRLAMTLEAGAMGTWEFDPAVQRSRFSSAQFALMGIAPTPDMTIATAEFYERVHPDDRAPLLQAITRANGDDATFRSEFRIVLRPGEVRWLAGEGRFVGAPGNGPRRLFGLNWDVTERRQREDELAALTRELERRVAARTAELTAVNGELEAFAYTVAHDLRAPLRNMSTLAEAVLEDLGHSIPAEQQGYLRRIVQASTRLDGMIQDLLAYSRIGREDQPATRVELRASVGAVLEQLGEPGRAVHVEGPAAHVQIHPRTLHQVLQNLVTNALKFVPPGRTPDVRVRVSRHDDRVRVEVHDNGIGIDPQHHARVFRVFERLHGQEMFPGTGIGLAIVKKGIERHGGRVGVESAGGAGSLFWFELPEAAET